MLPENLPWSKEIEMSILCLCGLGENQESIKEVCSLVRPEHFYSGNNRVIFQAIASMVKEGSAIDTPKICERLMADGMIEKAGGQLYLAQMTDMANWSADPHGDCMLLKRYAMLRGIAKAAHSMLSRSLLATEEPTDIAQETIKFLKALEEDLMADTQHATEQSDAVEMCASLETANQAVVVTGMRELDERIGGFRSGELVIVAAETGVGKTVFARQIRRESCALGVHGLYCSGEMDGEQLSAREAAARTGIPQWKFRNPWRMEREDFNRVLEFAAGECDKCEVLATNLTMSRINSAASAMRRRGQLKFIVVDYDELVEGTGGTDLEKQTNVVRACKSLSMSHRVPLILLSQLRKIQQGERADKPSIHRLYGASAKVKDASTILFIDRPFVRELKGEETEATIHIIKNRNGNVATIPCRFNVMRMRFVEDEPIQIP